MSWSSFYEQRVGDSYPQYCKTRYKVFVDILNSIGAKTISEEGCGIGTITKVIHSPSTKFTLFDYDRGQVSLAKRNLMRYANLTIELGDITNHRHKEKQDLIFSHGVLEHFSPEQMKIILKRQRRQSRSVVHYVPTAKYSSRSYGDELLKSKEWWIQNFKPTEAKTFNEDKDLVLIWR